MQPMIFNLEIKFKDGTVKTVKNCSEYGSNNGTHFYYTSKQKLEGNALVKVCEWINMKKIEDVHIEWIEEFENKNQKIEYIKAMKN